MPLPYVQKDVTGPAQRSTASCLPTNEVLLKLQDSARRTVLLSALYLETHCSKQSCSRAGDWQVVKIPEQCHWTLSLQLQNLPSEG